MCCEAGRSNPMRTWATAGLAVILLAAGSVVAVEAGDRPNILLILSDDQSYPHVGCYHNPDIKTPNLDQLASQGMRFDRAYVACPQCVSA